MGDGECRWRGDALDWGFREGLSEEITFEQDLSYKKELISGGLSLQWLEAGFWFPGQRLKSGCGSECAESQPRDHQGQWPVTRPWPIGFVEVNFHKETESSETSKVFIRRKKGTRG